MFVYVIYGLLPEIKDWWWWWWWWWKTALRGVCNTTCRYRSRNVRV